LVRLQLELAQDMNSIAFWLGCGLLILNCWSSIAVARDPGLTKKQKALQILLTWLLPVLGAAAFLSVRHFASRQKAGSPADSSLVVDDSHYISNGHF
jgi:hypothetical protein